MRVVVTPAASAALDELIRTQTLPTDTRERFRRSLRPLRSTPYLGPALEGRWDGFRFILGPWRWMVIVYRYDREQDEVFIVTVQDAGSGRAVTGGQRAP